MGGGIQTAIVPEGVDGARGRRQQGADRRPHGRRLLETIGHLRSSAGAGSTPPTRPTRRAWPSSATAWRPATGPARTHGQTDPRGWAGRSLDRDGRRCGRHQVPLFTPTSSPFLYLPRHAEPVDPQHAGREDDRRSGRSGRRRCAPPSSRPIAMFRFSACGRWRRSTTRTPRT